MRDQELIQALREHAECQKAFEDLGGESGIYADAYNDLAENFYGIPAAKVVSLHEIYRVIAGHSYYHGDRILAALTCIAEGKKVNPVRPSDVAESIDKDKLAKLICLDTLGYSAKNIEIITPEQYEAEFGGDEDG